MAFVSTPAMVPTLAASKTCEICASIGLVRSCTINVMPCCLAQQRLSSAPVSVLQVFNATPGQPGLVTWTGGNNTLNLYQQLLAAINNLGGNELGGPPAVDAAIAAAKAGTNVTANGGGVQIALVAGTDVSGLINTLSSFNEGSLAGFPHCAD